MHISEIQYHATKEIWDVDYITTSDEEDNDSDPDDDKINDAILKNWTLHSLVRLGTSYVLTFVNDARILDVRLINTAQGVDAIYSVVLNQSNNKIKVAATQSEEGKSRINRRNSPNPSQDLGGKMTRNY